MGWRRQIKQPYPLPPVGALPSHIALHLPSPTYLTHFHTSISPPPLPAPPAARLRRLKVKDERLNKRRKHEAGHDEVLWLLPPQARGHQGLEAAQAVEGGAGGGGMDTAVPGASPRRLHMGGQQG